MSTLYRHAMKTRGYPSCRYLLAIAKMTLETPIMQALDFFVPVGFALAHDKALTIFQKVIALR